MPVLTGGVNGAARLGASDESVWLLVSRTQTHVSAWHSEAMSSWRMRCTFLNVFWGTAPCRCGPGQAWRVGQLLPPLPGMADDPVHVSVLVTLLHDKRPRTQPRKVAALGPCGRGGWGACRSGVMVAGAGVTLYSSLVAPELGRVTTGVIFVSTCASPLPGFWFSVCVSYLFSGR